MDKEFLFSKIAGIPLQVCHFNRNGTSLKAFFNKVAIFISSCLLLGKIKETNCRVIEKHFKLNPPISQRMFRETAS